MAMSKENETIPKEKSLYEKLCNKIDNELCVTYLENIKLGLSNNSTRDDIVNKAFELFQKCRYVFNIDKRYKNKNDERYDEPFTIEVLKGAQDALKSFNWESLKSDKDSRFSKYLIVCIVNKINEYIAHEESPIVKMGLSFRCNDTSKQADEIDPVEQNRIVRRTIKRYKELFRIYSAMYRENLEKINLEISKQMCISLEKVKELYNLANGFSVNVDATFKDGEKQDNFVLDSAVASMKNRRNSEQEDLLISKENKRLILSRIEKYYEEVKEDKKKCISSVITCFVLENLINKNKKVRENIIHDSYLSTDSEDVYNELRKYHFTDKEMLENAFKKSTTWILPTDKELAELYGYKDRQGINKIKTRFLEKLKKDKELHDLLDIVSTTS